MERGSVSLANEAAMRKVFTSIEMPETVLVRDALLRQGIPASIQNVNSSLSAVPGFRAPAEVWVDSDGDADEARAIVKETLSRIDSESSDESWSCVACGEQSPGPFETCWSCGSPKDKATRR
jgi:hypothetical protein